MDKARRELGYQPKSYDFADVVASFMRDRSQTPGESEGRDGTIKSFRSLPESDPFAR